MVQDTIVIIELGSRETPRLAREIRQLGLNCEIRPHTITAEQLAAIPQVRGIILNGGPDRAACGADASADVSTEIYNAPVPVLLVDHKGDAPWPENDDKRRQTLLNFLFLCGVNIEE